MTILLLVPRRPSMSPGVQTTLATRRRAARAGPHKKTNSPAHAAFATQLTELPSTLTAWFDLTKQECAMNGLDIFVISFGLAFFFASDRFKRGVALLRAQTRQPRGR